MKILIATIAIVACFSGCYSHQDINNFSGYVVVHNRCGMEGFGGSYYILRNPKTLKVIKVMVDPAFCDTYMENDTIK